MTRYRIPLYAEWFCVGDVEADNLAEAREKVTELVRTGELKPLAGPGITFGEHRVIEAQEP